MNTDDCKVAPDVHVVQQLSSNCRQHIIDNLYCSILNNIKMSMDLHALLHRTHHNRINLVDPLQPLNSQQIIKVQKDLIDSYLLLEQLKAHVSQ